MGTGRVLETELALAAAPEPYCVRMCARSHARLDARAIANRLRDVGCSWKSPSLLGRIALWGLDAQHNLSMMVEDKTDRTGPHLHVY